MVKSVRLCWRLRIVVLRSVLRIVLWEIGLTGVHARLIQLPQTLNHALQHGVALSRHHKGQQERCAQISQARKIANSVHPLHWHQ